MGRNLKLKIYAFKFTGTPMYGLIVTYYLLKMVDNNKILTLPISRI